MSTFADFALLAAVPSYGGAEILRAQRVLPTGPGPRVHLSLFGRNEAVTRRVVAAAHAGAAVLHPAIARIYEVARFDGVVYGVGDPSEGLDLPALVGGKKGVPVELAVAIVASLARTAVSIHDSGGPGYRGPPLGFGAVLSGGLRLETVFVESTGAVRIRPLAAAGTDPEAASPFRAPEGEVSMAADVYALGRLLTALLSGDPSGRTAPRLPTSSPLPQLMSRMAHAQKAERPALHDAVVRLDVVCAQLASSPADEVIRAALAGPLRPLVVDPGFALEAPPRLVEPLRMQLAWVYSAVERLWPTLTPSAQPPPPPMLGPGQRSLPDRGSADVFAEARQGVRVRAKTAATVLFQEGAPPPAPSDGGRRKTRATRVMSDVALRTKALPPSSASQSASIGGETQAGSMSTSRPFVPPPPPPLLAHMAPPSLSAEEDRVFTGTGPAAPPADRAPRGVHRHEAGASRDPSDADDQTQVLLRADVDFDARGGGSPKRRPTASKKHTGYADSVGFGDDDVFAHDRATAAPLRVSSTSVAPAPMLSEPAGETSAYDFSNRPMTSEFNVEPAEDADASVSQERRTFAVGSTAGHPDGEEPLALDVDDDFVMVDEDGRPFAPAHDPPAARARTASQVAKIATTGSARDDKDRGAARARGSSRHAPAKAQVPELDGDDLHTEMVSVDRLASMLREVDASPTPLAQEPQAKPQPAVASPSPPHAEHRVPTPSRTSVDGALSSRLVVEAPDGATVSVNGAVMGVGTVSIDVGSAARCVVKVSLAGYVPFSTVVMVQGRPRVRVKPVLKPR